MTFETLSLYFAAACFFRRLQRIRYAGQKYCLLLLSRQSFHYTSPDGSMGRELRELTDRVDDLNYLIHLYLLGPQNENLIAIFPRTTQLLSAELAENTLTIHLSSGSSTLSDIQFTLAAAGLARSCLEFSAAQTVVIHCGDREITLDSTNMLFTDESAALETEE